MSKPHSLQAAVEDYGGFNAGDAVDAEMTDKQIRAYFTPKNYLAMFNDDDISDWGWTYSDMAEYAIASVREERERRKQEA